MTNRPNASNLPLGICSCSSSPVPRPVSPTLSKVGGGARAPLGYMAPAPLLTDEWTDGQTEF